MGIVEFFSMISARRVAKKKTNRGHQSVFRGQVKLIGVEAVAISKLTKDEAMAEKCKDEKVGRREPALDGKSCAHSWSRL
jgi:hypothetical protein